MEKDSAHQKMAEVVAKQQDMFFEKRNVVGVGDGHKVKGGKDTGRPCITVFVSQKLDRGLLGDQEIVPAEIEGFKTDIIETGEIFAGVDMDDDGTEETPVHGCGDVSLREELGIQTLRQRVRPAMGGFSVGHYKVTAGTIGTCVYDLAPFPGIPQRYYILSNNHVLANSNNARIGDPILQPGPYDGGTVPNDIVARLSRFVPIKFKTATSAPVNYVDAAIAEGPFHTLNRQVYWIGYVQQVKSNPKVGDLVEKTGRTTNFTTGRIISTSATFDVNYGSGRVARFGRQIAATPMSAGGDSGSLVCDIKEGAVGLLFAGSPSITIVNSILHVQSLLGIRLHP